MVAAFDLHGFGSLGQQVGVVLELGAVEHLVVRAVQGDGAQVRARQVAGGVGSQQHEAVERAVAGMVDRVLRRHRAAQRVAAHPPGAHVGEVRAHAVGCVDVEEREVERHLDHYGQVAALGQIAHERRVRAVFHLRAGVEHEADGCVRVAERKVVVSLLDGQRLGRHEVAMMGVQVVVRVARVREERGCQHAQQDGEGRQRDDELARFAARGDGGVAFGRFRRGCGFVRFHGEYGSKRASCAAPDLQRLPCISSS